MNLTNAVGLLIFAIAVVTLANARTHETVALPHDRIQLPADTEPPAEIQPGVITSTDPVSGVTVDRAAVILLSTAGCAPCEAFKRGPMPAELVSKGWRYEAVEGRSSPTGQYPAWRVYDGNQWHTIAHPFTAGKLSALLSGRVRSTGQPRSQSSTCTCENCQCTSQVSYQSTDSVVFESRPVASGRPVRQFAGRLFSGRVFAPLRARFGGGCR